MYKSLWQRIKKGVRSLSGQMRARTQSRSQPLIITRENHNISRSMISSNALKVLYRLKNEGYEAYLVGGGVRDLLMGYEPKDFDIATNAEPEDIKRCFRNCRLIGRRFRLAHIFFQQDIIEVATFRASIPTQDQQHVHSDSGMLLRDNVYGDIREDAWRRDFTINALYYNIEDFSVRDYVGGMHDLKCGQLRMIGDPQTRYAEDPVRILRAVRISVKLGLNIHPDTEAPIHTNAHLLADVAPGRMYEEFKKMFLTGQACENFAKLKHFGLLDYVLPLTADALRDATLSSQYDFIHVALKNTDSRIQEDRPVNVGFLLATLLWHPVMDLMQQYLDEDMPKMIAFEKSYRKAIAKQSKIMSMPRFVSSCVSDILHLQMRLMQINHPKSLRILEHNRFKAAYDFLLLRAQAGEDIKDLASWWTAFFEADPHERTKMMRRRVTRSRGGRSNSSRRYNDNDSCEDRHNDTDNSQ